MSNPILEDIANWLTNQGIVGGSTGWAIYNSFLPPDPDKAISITEIPGEYADVVRDLTIGENPYDILGFQIRGRSAVNGYADLRAEMQLIYTGLHQNEPSVWGSIGWKQETASAGFSPRVDCQVLFLKDKLWLIGGSDGFTVMNDVWNSSDGITWTQITASASFSPRDEFWAVVFEDKLWIIGGYGSRALADVWNSSDGITWNQVTPDGGFGARFSHVACVFNNKIWIIGGQLLSGLDSNDVWSSSDGITWTQVTSNGGFPIREDHAVAVFGGKMIISGGDDSNGSGNPWSDVWASEDGITWVELISAPPWTGRVKHFFMAQGQNLFLGAGIGGTRINTEFNDLWTSRDGVLWLPVLTSQKFSARAGFGYAFLNDKIYIVAGYDTNNLHDVWSIDLYSGQYVFIYAKTSGPLPMGKDSSNRDELSWNFRVMRKR